MYMMSLFCPELLVNLAGLTVLKKAKLQEILEKSFLYRHKFFSKGTESLRAAIFAVHIFNRACKHITAGGGGGNREILGKTTAPSLEPAPFSKTPESLPLLHFPQTFNKDQVNTNSVEIHSSVHTSIKHFDITQVIQKATQKRQKSLMIKK